MRTHASKEQSLARLWTEVSALPHHLHLRTNSPSADSEVVTNCESDRVQKLKPTNAFAREFIEATFGWVWRHSNLDRRLCPLQTLIGTSCRIFIYAVPRGQNWETLARLFAIRIGTRLDALFQSGLVSSRCPTVLNRIPCFHKLFGLEVVTRKWYLLSCLLFGFGAANPTTNLQATDSADHIACP